MTYSVRWLQYQWKPQLSNNKKKDVYVSKMYYVLMIYYYYSRLIGIARIYQRGGHTVSKWGYSPDSHVDLHAMFFIKKSLKIGPFNYGQDIVML